MRCRYQQQTPLRQLTTDSTLGSLRRRVQHEQQSVNFDDWNMNFCNVTSFETSLHNFGANNLRITASFHRNTLTNNHLLRGIRRIHHQTTSRLNISHQNNHRYKHLPLFHRCIKPIRRMHRIRALQRSRSWVAELDVYAS